MPSEPGSKRIALVTGVGRRAGIGFAIAERLIRDGFDVAATGWARYDQRMPWGAEERGGTRLPAIADELGSKTVEIASDLENPSAIGPLFDDVESQLGPVDALVLCHCESVASDLTTTSLESFDRHFAVNARASWLLIREFALRFKSPVGLGRIVALTSDATVGNLPYGASKGALDRVIISAARELGHFGITANAVNPGPTDNGWMDEQLRLTISGETPLGRLGVPSDASNLVSFLCSDAGGWVNGQLIHSDGGLHAH